MTNKQTWDEAAKRMAKEFNNHRSCAACEYYQSDPPDEISMPARGKPRRGQCRRHSPALVYDKRFRLAECSTFPAVALTDWCGEFSPRGER